jgi:eukaryotic-like serine/threonine-protein kinase
VGQGRLAPDVVLNGTYRIVRLVGKGGVGEVYEAVHDRLTKKRFAVKVLLEELSGRKDVIDRFQREADVLSDLGHPNIVEIFDFAQTADGVSYLVMEFIDGVDLAEEIRLHGPMPPKKAANVVGQLASALDAVHSRGIIHRDLKPGNVILTRKPGHDEVVKILDFGIAKVREATVELTRQDAILGTPQYMAPEQASGHLGEIDERTDQFSLAAIAYELVTGEPPFGGKDAASILFRVVHEPPSPFRFPLPATEAAILYGLSKNKAQRFPSVRDLHQALVEAADTDVWPPPPVSQTLLETKPAAVEAPAEKRAPTALLPGKSTTLSKAAGASTAERTISSRRRWLLPALIVLAVGGVAAVVAVLRTREVSRSPAPEPARNVIVQSPPVALPTPMAPDAATVVERRDAQPPPVAVPSPTAKPAAPAPDEPARPRARKSADQKKTKLRNEDL